MLEPTPAALNSGIAIGASAPADRSRRGALALTRLALIAFLLAFSACGIRSRPQLRWIGQVTPTTNAPTCEASTGVLLLRENEVVFTPDEGTWVLSGTATPDGNIVATHSRRTSDAKRNYETDLKAHYTDSEVTGTYTTPRCTYNVALKRG